MIHKLKAIWAIIRSRDYLLVTNSKKQWRVVNTYPADRISQSGKAFYLS